jgi:integrase
VAQNESYYRDRREHYEGRVVMFRRPDSWHRGEDRIWQVRFKLEGLAGYKTVSLKTPIYEVAYAKARDLYLHFQQMVREGASLRERTFAQAWQEWFNQMDGDGVWSDSRKKWHLNYFNRYFNAYFGSKKLDQINMDFANSYWGWRKRYWVDGPGVNPAANQLKYNRRRRGMGNISTHNAKKKPAHKTLLMEQAALNQIFSWCYDKKFMRYGIKMKMKVPASQRNKKREGIRPGFTDDEWEFLTFSLRSWADADGKYAKDRLNDFHRHHRKQLRFYVLFVGYTGIRPGTETRLMKWEDISPRKIMMEDKETGMKFPEVVLEIGIRENAKTGKRTALSLPDVVGSMEEWRKMSN